MLLPKLVKRPMPKDEAMGCYHCRLFIACPELTPKCIVQDEKTGVITFYKYEEKENT